MLLPSLRRFCLPLFAAVLFAASLTPVSRAQAPQPPVRDEGPFAGEPYHRAEPGDLAGATREQLNASMSVPLSSMGRWSKLALQYWNGSNYDILLADGDLSNPAAAVSSPVYDGEPALNRGATLLAYTSKRDGNYEIYTLDLITGLNRRLTYSGAADGMAAWSPDGLTLAFVSDRSGLDEIYLMDLNGGNVRRAVDTGGLPAFSPAWSPDGKKLAFVLDRGGALGDICVFDFDGWSGMACAYPYGQPYVQHPVWSPSEPDILYFDAGDAYFHYYNRVIKMKMHAWSTRVNIPYDTVTEDHWMGAISPNGEQIAFLRVKYIEQNGQLAIQSMSLETTCLHRDTSCESSSPVRLAEGVLFTPTWQSLDITPPVSRLEPLPEFSKTMPLLKWASDSTGLAPVNTYNLQFQTGGTWWDVVTGYTSTRNLFPAESINTQYFFYNPPTPGTTFRFRLRAGDEAGQVEDWTESGDRTAQTTLYSWSFGGRTLDVRANPISGVTVSAAPGLINSSEVSDASGRFDAYLANLGAHTFQFNGNYASLSFPVPTAADQVRDVVLQPAGNLLANPDFETAALGGWTAWGDFPAAAASAPYSGAQSAILRPAAPPYLGSGEAFTGISGYVYVPVDFVGEADGAFQVLYAVQGDGVFVRRRAADGTWGAPVELADLTGTPGLFNVSLQRDGDGNLHAFWHGLTGSLSYLNHAVLPPAGVWTSSTRLPIQYTYFIKVYVGPSGRVHVLASGGDGGSAINYWEQQPGQTWVGPLPLGGAGLGKPGAFYEAPDGALYVLYSTNETMYRSRTPGGQWSPAVTLGSYSEAGAAVLPAPDGNLYLMVDSRLWRKTAIRIETLASAPLSLNRPLGVFAFINPSGQLELAGAGYRVRLGPDGEWTPFEPWISNVRATWMDAQGNLSAVEFAAPHYLFRPAAPSAAGSGGLSQPAALSAEMHLPTLSALLRFEDPAGQSSYDIRWVTGAGEVVLASGDASHGWQHRWVDMTPYAGQTGEVRFSLHQAAGTAPASLWVDNVALVESLYPVLNSVEPAALPDARTGAQLTLHGDNFLPGAVVQIDSELYPVMIPQWVDEQTLVVTLNRSLAYGPHRVRVLNRPETGTPRAATLENAFSSGHTVALPAVRR